MADPQIILDFWFKEVSPSNWYVSSEALDVQIAQRFEPFWHQAMAGALIGWLETHQGALAYLIVTDQFSRNMFRGKAQAFASDVKALAAARLSIERGYDLQTAEPARQFFYLPFEHSENLEDQDEGVCLISDRISYDGGQVLLHAKAHREIIRRFGRFPYRNQALERAMTEQEQAFIDAGGYAAALRYVEGLPE